MHEKLSDNSFKNNLEIKVFGNMIGAGFSDDDDDDDENDEKIEGDIDGDDDIEDQDDEKEDILRINDSTNREHKIMQDDRFDKNVTFLFKLLIFLCFINLVRFYE